MWRIGGGGGGGCNDGFGRLYGFCSFRETALSFCIQIAAKAIS
jgi:hypothetical protein